jgi:hypothetical protein
MRACAKLPKDWESQSSLPEHGCRGPANESAAGAALRMDGVIPSLSPTFAPKRKYLTVQPTANMTRADTKRRAFKCLLTLRTIEWE